MDMLLETYGYIVNKKCMVTILQNMCNIDGNSTDLNI